MNKYFLGMLAGLCLWGCGSTSKQQENAGQEQANTVTFSQAQVKEALDFSVQQYLGMAKHLPDSIMPRTTNTKDGSLRTSGTSWWTSGFYPGTLWYLYEASGNEQIKQEAIKRTAYIEKEKHNKGTHDLGFMLYCSFGNGYRLTDNEAYKEIMITGANSLSTRFDETVGCIKSWDHGKWKFPVIIDNMMNLEFLFWATKATGDSSYYHTAVKHADTTLKNHFRADHSSYHVIDYDPETGEVVQKKTHQGFSDESAWARGQMWGLYGYILCYRETQQPRYLDQAIHIAEFVLNHPNLPEDLVPYWDFNAVDIPKASRDVSAGSLLCSALLELSQYVDTDKKTKYLEAAEQLLISLSSDKYRAKLGENNHFLLKYSVGSMPHNSEVDVPLTYADYYYIEALLRFQELSRKS
ncbi:glycoside hydrolase family 88 protein [Rapidithrix thailandica]|uniref:Glycoside hydrolase family 88 protein n=1 Tax=Rapidithrix thailandica TaxID=413964 RepID=A0AAW9S505_9BACT